MKLEQKENGTLVYDGIAVGKFDEVEGRLVLDAGWMTAAGLKITVLGDPSQDRRRKLLERPVDVRNPEGTKGEQRRIDDELTPEEPKT